WLSRGGTMQAGTLPTWIARRIAVRPRLERRCVSYLLFLRVVTQQHSLEEAARFSRLNKAQFCQWLKAHSDIAVYTFPELAKKQPRQFAPSRQSLQGLPWHMALLVASTRQQRASVHPENAKKLNHGKGFIIGHQWTHLVLMLHDILIPLPPIPYYSKR